MSRGLARRAIIKRIETIIDNVKLPSRKTDNESSAEPQIFEQFPNIENDDQPDAPSITVNLGKAIQTIEGKTAEVLIACMVYAKDSEQGFRDAENLIEKIEIDLIQDPMLDEGSFLLLGDWDTDLTSHFPIFIASLSCKIQLPAVLINNSEV